jgi:hypothetical protein
MRWYKIFLVLFWCGLLALNIVYYAGLFPSDPTTALTVARLVGFPLVFLLLAGWIGAWIRVRARTDLSSGQRSVWSAVVGLLFVIGATAFAFNDREAPVR